ncbi:MAG: lantibiotic ABC transporter permease [delta proteobacterium ML8_F1]|nr:MAG: lantibiotic ABC transporter permease [delta proteobacterium ML8_F1]
MTRLAQYKATGILVLAAYGFMIGMNILANALPINGLTTGEVSDNFENLFAPTGLTFSIWGLIYLFLGGYTLYQLKIMDSATSHRRKNIFYKIGLLFCLSSVANGAWIAAWHYLKLDLSILLMAVILISLILTHRILDRESLRGKDYWLIKAPFSLYFGWITVATIANVTSALVFYGWEGFGLSEPLWTVIILGVGMVIGILTLLRFKDPLYGGVLLWAYLGIYIKHTSPSGFDNAFPQVILAVSVTAFLILFTTGYVLKKH